MIRFFKVLDFDASKKTNRAVEQRQPETSKSEPRYYRGLFSKASSFMWSTMNNYLTKAVAGEEHERDEISEEKLRYYENKLKTAQTYEEWYQASEKLDDLEGNADWMEELQSNDYDWKLLQNRIDEIVESRKRENNRKAMTFTLKLGQTRNLGDMCNAKLYGKTRVGTKKLIADYTDKVIEQLDWIGDVNVEDENDIDDMSLQERHDYFMAIRRSYGRTALMLSGGGTLGFFHLGVLRALINARLLPRIISGASTGSIMATLICTANEEERIELLNTPSSIPREVFEKDDSPNTTLLILNRYLTEGNLYDPSILKGILRDRIGDITFKEAYNVSRLILNIAVSSDSLFDMPSLLNYMTSPDVVIWSAVLASCAVPLVFPAQEILVKTKSGDFMPWTSTSDKYRDGSIDNDLPIKRISEMFSINHFIVVQLNPHIAPFIYKGHGVPSPLRSGVNFILQMVKGEVLHRCAQFKELDIATSFFKRLENVITQKYMGDITLAPELTFDDVSKILTNPKLEFIVDFINKGERAAWQKMTEMKHSLRIELAIDTAIYRLRSKLLGESPQIPVEKEADNGYIMGPSPSNSTSYIGLTPSSSLQNIGVISPSISEYRQSSDEEEEELRVSLFGDENSAYSPMSPQIPSTPSWQTENFNRSRNSSFSIHHSLLTANLRKNSLLPHDISRRGSNVSIRDVSPSTSTKLERRKQITSAQFFISPEFEWAPTTTEQNFKNSVSILAQKGAEAEAKAIARKKNAALSIHIPTK